MKKFIIAFCSIIVLASCSAARIDVTYVDYNKYYQDGFLITPAQYYQKFEPCGEIFISVTPGYTQSQTTVQTTSINNNGYNRYGNYVIGSKKQETAQQTTVVTQRDDKEIRTIDDVVEIAVKEAKERGANTLSNFKCNIVYNPNFNTIIRYEVSGFCIKRNDK